MIELELPNDFIHEAPTGYSYSVSKFKPNVLSIWLNHHKEYIYTSEPVKSIWGFVKFTKKGHKYYSPINSKKVGKEIDIDETRPFTSMRLNLNPLEAAFF